MRLPLRWFAPLRWLLLAYVTAGTVVAREIVLVVEDDMPPAEFAAAEIASALRGRGDEVSRRASNVATDAVISLRRDDTLANEAFVLERDHSEGRLRVTVRGGGAGGVMYGGIELAEQIQIGGLDRVTHTARAPHFAMRGTKFNLPLDARTPSYSDMGDSAQQNIETVWDFEFWRAYLDRLARDRYNYVSLWNLHPFPSMVRVPEYPEVALADVQRSRGPFAEHYSTRTEDIVTPAMLANAETIKRLTIDEKIEFWRRVMQHAQDRNIGIYLVTWNIYTYGVGGKYGIDDDIANPTTTDYFRRSVAALFRTYPLLRGIGVTAGENIGRHDSSFQAKEDWLFATYGQGVLDVARAEPQRKITFIHRQHEASAQAIARTFASLRAAPNVDFVFSFKYAQAHALSSTVQTFHRDFVPSLGGLKTLWTLRNDDALIFRWAAPDFVREFITGMPREATQGVYYGSDMWVWGRDVLDRDAKKSRSLEIEKHWLHWWLWGRLSYDPTITNERIAAVVGRRFPEVDGATLLKAWQHASMTYPLTTGFHWGQFDFQWYIEACKSRPGPAQTASGFHDVNRFITLGVHPGTDNISIPRYVEGVTRGPMPAGTTPLEVAEKLDQHADAALTALDSLSASGNDELESTLADIRAMATLGKYYAGKIRGATALALFRVTERREDQARAVEELTRAATHWSAYAASAASRYKNPIWTNRVGYVNWDELSAEVARDITLARDGG